MNESPVLLGTNWKMNKTTREAADYTCLLLKELGSLLHLETVQLFIIPPFTAISAVKQSSLGKFWVGAQNMHHEVSGAFTGEISAAMLQDLCVDLVELGHAERRLYFRETDDTINRKVRLALEYGLRPLLCVGELEEEKAFGVEREAVARQIKIALNGVSKEQASSLIVAYEPAWSIGESGVAADVEYIRVMNRHVREILSGLFGPEASKCVPVIYGGDVNESNAAEILTGSATDGLFIGRAAWEAEGFAAIIRLCLEAISPEGGASHPAGRRSRKGGKC